MLRVMTIRNSLSFHSWLQDTFHQIEPSFPLGSQPFAARHRAVKSQALEPHSLSMALCKTLCVPYKTHRSAALCQPDNQREAPLRAQRERSAQAVPLRCGAQLSGESLGLPNAHLARHM